MSGAPPRNANTAVGSGGRPGGNYFEFVGCRIADKLLQHRSRLRIWVE